MPLNKHKIVEFPGMDSIYILRDAKYNEYIANHPENIISRHEFDQLTCDTALSEFFDSFGPTSDYSCGDFKAPHDMALREGFNNKSLRSVYWRVLLDNFSELPQPQHWNETIQRQADDWHVLIQRYGLPQYCSETNTYTLTTVTESTPTTSSPTTTTESTTKTQSSLSLLTSENLASYIELCDTIKLDLIRTFPSCHYFSHPDTQDQLLAILYIWCCHYNEGYKQGMNELVASLLYATTYDSVTFSTQNCFQMNQRCQIIAQNLHLDTNDDPMQALLSTNRSHTGHVDDIYSQLDNNQDRKDYLGLILVALLSEKNILPAVFAMFSSLMVKLGQYYNVSAAFLAQQTTLSVSGGISLTTKAAISLGARSGALASISNTQDHHHHHHHSSLSPFEQLQQQKDKIHGGGGISQPLTPSEPPIVLISQYIFHTLLPVYDPDLYRHLIALDIIPTVFLLRWIRLLFMREYPSLDTVHIIHDALFADIDLSLLPYIAVAMLHLKRHAILAAEDAGDCFDSLLRNAHTDWSDDDDDNDDDDDDQIDTTNHEKQQQQLGGDDVFLQDVLTSPQPSEADGFTLISDINTPIDTQQAVLIDTSDLASTPNTAAAATATAATTTTDSWDEEIILVEATSPQSTTSTHLSSSPHSTSTTTTKDTPKLPKKTRPLAICHHDTVNEVPTQVVQLAIRLSKKLQQIPKTGKPLSHAKLQLIAAQNGKNVNELWAPVPPLAAGSANSSNSSTSKLRLRTKLGSSSTPSKAGKSSSSGGGNVIGQSVFSFVSKISQALDSNTPNVRRDRKNKQPVSQQQQHLDNETDSDRDVLHLPGSSSRARGGAVSRHPLHRQEDITSSPTAPTGPNSEVLCQESLVITQNIVDQLNNLIQSTTTTTTSGSEGVTAGVPEAILQGQHSGGGVIIDDASSISDHHPVDTLISPDHNNNESASSNVIQPNNNVQVPLATLVSLCDYANQLHQKLQTLSQLGLIINTDYFNSTSVSSYPTTSAAELARIGQPSLYSKTSFNAYSDEQLQQQQQQQQQQMPPQSPQQVSETNVVVTTQQQTPSNRPPRPAAYLLLDNARKTPSPMSSEPTGTISVTTTIPTTTPESVESLLHKDLFDGIDESNDSNMTTVSHQLQKESNHTPTIIAPEETAATTAASSTVYATAALSPSAPLVTTDGGVDKQINVQISSTIEEKSIPPQPSFTKNIGGLVFSELSDSSDNDDNDNDNDNQDIHTNSTRLNHHSTLLPDSTETNSLPTIDPIIDTPTPSVISVSTASASSLPTVTPVSQIHVKTSTPATITAPAQATITSSRSIFDEDDDDDENGSIFASSSSRPTAFKTTTTTTPTIPKASTPYAQQHQPEIYETAQSSYLSNGDKLRSSNTTTTNTTPLSKPTAEPSHNINKHPLFAENTEDLFSSKPTLDFGLNLFD